jgi:hypothetical protein
LNNNNNNKKKKFKSSEFSRTPHASSLQRHRSHRTSQSLIFVQALYPEEETIQNNKKKKIIIIKYKKKKKYSPTKKEGARKLLKSAGRHRLGGEFSDSCVHES